MEVSRVATRKGPAEWFTGEVWIHSVAEAYGSSQVSGGDPEWGAHVTDAEYRGQG